MSLKSFSRHQNEIICDSSEIQEVITKWTQNEGWEFKDFSIFLKLVGVQTPVEISNFNKDQYSFKCITALKTEVTLYLRFGDAFDNFSELWVTEGDETKKYITNFNFIKGETVPDVILQRKSILKNGKELSCFYDDNFCNRCLYLDATHTLKVYFSELNKPFNNPSFLTCQQVEDYLITLDKSLVIDEVFAKVVELLELSPEDVSNISKILFSYIETTSEKESRIKSMISKIHGKMQEYAVFENGETFHVSIGGNWSYTSDTVQISYRTEKDYSFSVTGSETFITNMNPKKMLVRVKKRISELMKFIEAN